MSKEAEERRATAWRARHMHIYMCMSERRCRRVHQALCGTGAVQTKGDEQGQRRGTGCRHSKEGTVGTGANSLLLREVGRELEHGQRLACDQWGGAGEQG